LLTGPRCVCPEPVLAKHHRFSTES
jgi:hypothetical protein